MHISLKHRSLSRTPWELYYARSSPHPFKTITPFEIFTSSFVEACSKPSNDTISNLESYDINTGIRDHADLQNRLTISSLTQTRKVQVENYRRISKPKTSNLKVEVEMVVYIRNPKYSVKIKKNIREPCSKIR